MSVSATIQKHLDDDAAMCRVIDAAQQGEPGARCPRSSAGDACHVDSWVYEMQSIHPRMFGRCDTCGTIYVVVLPRRRGDECYTAGHWDDVLDHWRTVTKADVVDVVVEAAERTMLRSGFAQRLWMMLSERPMAIPREIVRTIRMHADEEVRSHQKRIDDACRMLYDRIQEFRDKQAELSTKGARRTALKALEAAKAQRARMASDREEAARLRATVSEIKADIATAREAARREPLPIPEGYTPPPLDRRAVLCDEITPSEVVYALVDPADPELVRYVGRTCDPTSRYRMHCTNGSDAVTGWAKSVMAEGRKPAMVLIEQCERDVIEARERYWIRYYRDRFQADLNRSIPKSDG
ncbi:MAG TPA: hypothetical protein VEB19_08305 [Gemmatimonadaceae bacterium]|nr:hypothetical protein [Gemmatimonadaceae bacterium]